MAIPYLKLGDNGVYNIHWTEPGGRNKRVSTRQRDLGKAEAVFGEWLILEREAPRPDALTVAAAWSVYLTKHIEPNAAAPDTATNSWKNLEPQFGALTAAALSQDLLDDYVAKRGAGKIGRPAQPQTCRRELSVMFTALRFARQAVPEGLKLPAEGEPRDRWLRADETRRLFDAAAALRRGPRLSRGERFLWLALETAARKTALYELTWDRVDFETNVVHLDVPGRKQTKKRRAAVPISRALRPILLRAYKERETDMVLDHGAEIWPTAQTIAVKAGFGGERAPVKTGKKPRATGISPHVLRHTAATHMARRGVPLWKIAKVLGNSLAVVEKVYAKHAPDDLREAVDLISNGALEAAG